MKTKVPTPKKKIVLILKDHLIPSLNIDVSKAPKATKTIYITTCLTGFLKNLEVMFYSPPTSHYSETISNL